MLGLLIVSVSALATVQPKDHSKQFHYKKNLPTSAYIIASNPSAALSKTPDKINNIHKELKKLAYGGQIGEAIKLAETYLATHEDLAIRTFLARMLGWQKHYESAKEQLLYVLAKDPRNYDAIDTLSDIDLWSENYNSAANYINIGLKYYPNNEQLLDKKIIISARLLAASHRINEAITQLEDTLENRDSENIRLYLASLYLRQRQFENAKTQLHFLLSKSPKNQDAILLLADIEIAAGNNNQALKTLSDGLNYYPQSQPLLEKRAILLTKLSSSVAAHRITGTSNISGALKPSTTLPKAGSNTNNKSFETISKLAIASADDVQNLDHQEKLKIAGYTYEEIREMGLNSNKRKQAIQIAKEYLIKNDDNDVRILLGQMLAWEKNYEASRKELEIAVKKQPRNIEASIALANTEMWSNNKARAIQIIDNALELNPGKRELTSLKEKFLADNDQNLDQRKKLMIAGQSYEEIREMGLNSSKRKQAIQLAKEYLIKNDDNDIRILLGQMLAWEKDYEASRKELDNAVKRQPKNIEASIALANTEMWSNNKVRAIQVINNALEFNPNNRELTSLKDKFLADNDPKINNYKEIRLLVDSKQYNKAREKAIAALKVQEDYDIRTLLGLIESWEHNYSEAKRQFQIVLKSKPDYIDARLGLININIWTKNYKQAQVLITEGLNYNPEHPSLISKQFQVNQLTILPSQQPGLVNPLIARGVINTGNLVGPNTPGGKLNALGVDYNLSHVRDLNLKQYWRTQGINYQRYTPLGSVIVSAYKTNRFNIPGNQFFLEAYPILGKKAYAYVAYARSKTSYLPQNYYTIEPYFEYGKGNELSFGSRILEFQTNTVILYTGSLGKYIENYWFSFRPTFTNQNGKSYSFTARRYFSSALSYISITLNKGEGDSSYDLSQPNPDVSALATSGVILNGYYPLSDALIFSWLGSYFREQYPNENIRKIKTIYGGLIWRF